ncbi:3-phosphoshikimate 1-carboxyvinyltransferase [Virgibacillus kimchii]
MKQTLKPSSQRLTGTIHVPGDKSISHRAVILGAIAEGRTEVKHFLNSEDVMRTIKAFREMGVVINKSDDALSIEGKGIGALKEPLFPLYFGNSGTTTRLMMGLLAGLPFFTTIYGDDSLTKRPMNRVADPLKMMGAKIDGRNEGNLLPLSIRGSSLKGIDYHLPVKSAQVKSCLLLAGLLADGVTKISEDTLTRNHSEKMLKAFGADIHSENNTTTITNKNSLSAVPVFVPGDISSAAFFLAAAAIVPGSRLLLKNTGLNKTRTGILEVLHDMGADLQILHEEEVGGEHIGDIQIAYQELRGTTIEGDLIPRLIDEIPIIALIATQAEGTTIIRDAEELRVKETDRIQAVVDVLSSLGANIEATEDGMIIHGKNTLPGGIIPPYNDHRIAMMAAIASLIVKEEVVLEDASPINTSYPDFFKDLDRVIK